MSVATKTLAAVAMAVAALGARADVAADSVADYSGVQGQGGWYYGYYSGLLNTASFQLLPNFAPGSGWTQGTANGLYWTVIGSGTAHPQGTITSWGRVPDEQWAVRRWVASDAGTYVVNLNLAKTAAGLGGNGVLGHVFLDGAEVYQRWIDGTDTSGVSARLVLDLHVGSTIDFALDPFQGEDFYDSTRFTVQISAVPVPEPSSAGLSLAGLAALGLMLLLRGRRVARQRSVAA